MLFRPLFFCRPNPKGIIRHRGDLQLIPTIFDNDPYSWFMYGLYMLNFVLFFVFNSYRTIHNIYYTCIIWIPLHVLLVIDSCIVTYYFTKYRLYITSSPSYFLVWANHCFIIVAVCISCAKEHGIGRLVNIPNYYFGGLSVYRGLLPSMGPIIHEEKHKNSMAYVMYHRFYMTFIHLIIQIVYYGCSFILCAVGICARTDITGQSMTFLDCIYFVIVSASTVGYGDIVPVTVEGRIFVMIFIILIMVFVPLFISNGFSQYTEEKAFMNVRKAARKSIIVVAAQTYSYVKLIRMAVKEETNIGLIDIQTDQAMGHVQLHEMCKRTTNLSLIPSNDGTNISARFLTKAGVPEANTILCLAGSSASAGGGNPDAALLLSLLSMARLARKNAHLIVLTVNRASNYSIHNLLQAEHELVSVFSTSETFTKIIVLNLLFPGVATFIVNLMLPRRLAIGNVAGQDPQFQNTEKRHSVIQRLFDRLHKESDADSDSEEAPEDGLRKMVPLRPPGRLAEARAPPHNIINDYEDEEGDMLRMSAGAYYEDALPMEAASFDSGVSIPNEPSNEHSVSEHSRLGNTESSTRKGGKAMDTGLQQNISPASAYVSTKPQANPSAATGPGTTTTDSTTGSTKDGTNIKNAAETYDAPRQRTVETLDTQAASSSSCALPRSKDEEVEQSLDLIRPADAVRRDEHFPHHAPKRTQSLNIVQDAVLPSESSDDKLMPDSTTSIQKLLPTSLGKPISQKVIDVSVKAQLTADDFGLPNMEGRISAHLNSDTGLYGMMETPRMDPSQEMLSGYAQVNDPNKLPSLKSEVLKQFQQSKQAVERRRYSFDKFGVSNNAAALSRIAKAVASFMHHTSRIPHPDSASLGIISGKNLASRMFVTGDPLRRHNINRVGYYYIGNKNLELFSRKTQNFTGLRIKQGSIPSVSTMIERYMYRRRGFTYIMVPGRRHKRRVLQQSVMGYDLLIKAHDDCFCFERWSCHKILKLKRLYKRDTEHHGSGSIRFSLMPEYADKMYEYAVSLTKTVTVSFVESVVLTQERTAKHVSGATRLAGYVHMHTPAVPCSVSDDQVALVTQPRPICVLAFLVLSEFSTSLFVYLLAELMKHNDKYTEVLFIVDESVDGAQDGIDNIANSEDLRYGIPITCNTANTFDMKALAALRFQEVDTCFLVSLNDVVPTSIGLMHLAYSVCESFSIKHVQLYVNNVIKMVVPQSKYPRLYRQGHLIPNLDAIVSASLLSSSTNAVLMMELLDKIYTNMSRIRLFTVTLLYDVCGIVSKILTVEGVQCMLGSMGLEVLFFSIEGAIVPCPSPRLLMYNNDYVVAYPLDLDKLVVNS